ncbi:hypothetical protein LSH36_58g18041 [Paralvinella palmiformis]|uniref:CREB regulated transcription coactivator 1 n=1 Tax=Paralvinella palmiformis TaxID=53620 RepID=A0AAD9K5C7_9ANNE|nr:hypothetical protein LSH36_58g18041 [Paralvinella palmiformis]
MPLVGWPRGPPASSESQQAIMANPRKFSEKIALHNQKQAEETAAFEAILREVSATTRGALHSLEGMKQPPGRQSLVDRMHRDRNRPIPGHGRRSAPFDKRADHSPYGSAYLSPPPDTSWRRTNSDSALHTSTVAPQVQTLPGGTTPPTNRREVAFCDIIQSSPIDCIYPSPEQDSDIQGIHIPISNNTGSLPDLTNLHFPSGLVTPLDSEDLQQQGYTQVSTHSNLSPTSAHQVLSSSDQTSGAIRRRGGPAPLVLQGQAGLSQLTQQMVQQVCGHSQVYAPC